MQHKNCLKIKKEGQNSKCNVTVVPEKVITCKISVILSLIRVRQEYKVGFIQFRERYFIQRRSSDDTISY